jgi:hypothetical protein
MGGGWGLRLKLSAGVLAGNPDYFNSEDASEDAVLSPISYVYPTMQSQLLNYDDSSMRIISYLGRCLSYTSDSSSVGVLLAFKSCGDYPFSGQRFAFDPTSSQLLVPFFEAPCSDGSYSCRFCVNPCGSGLDCQYTSSAGESFQKLSISECVGQAFTILLDCPPGATALIDTKMSLTFNMLRVLLVEYNQLV